MQHRIEEYPPHPIKITSIRKSTQKQPPHQYVYLLMHIIIPSSRIRLSIQFFTPLTMKLSKSHTYLSWTYDKSLHTNELFHLNTTMHFTPQLLSPTINNHIILVYIKLKSNRSMKGWSSFFTPHLFPKHRLSTITKLLSQSMI